MPEAIYCAFHNKMEPVTPNGTICFECRHSYANNQAIMDEYEATFKRTVQIEDILYCPLCLHDWVGEFGPAEEESE